MKYEKNENIKKKQKKEEKMKRRTKKFDRNKGITLIALVITIVLNCCEAAMARVNKFEKIKNLMYNIDYVT